MAESSLEHAAEARAALQVIVSDPDHGASALSSEKVMANLLKDLLPDAPRERALLVSAAEHGVAAMLRERVAQGLDTETAIRLAAASFAEATPFTPEAGEWTVREVALALGLVTAGNAGPAGLGAGAAAGPTAALQPTVAPGAPSPGQSPAFQPGARVPEATAPGPGAGPGPGPVPGQQPATVYAQPSGQAPGPPAPTMPPGLVAVAPATPAGSNRTRNAVLVIGACVLVAAGAIVAVFVTRGSGARSGTESFVLTGQSGSDLAITASGVFSAQGTEKPGTATSVITFPGGTVTVYNPKHQPHFTESFNSSTCAATFRGAGQVRLGGGTGTYAGLTGSASYTEVATGILSRASGSCSSSSQLTGPVQIVIHASGPVTLP